MSNNTPLVYFTTLKNKPFKTTYDVLFEKYNQLSDLSFINQIEILKFLGEITSHNTKFKYFENVNERKKFREFAIKEVWKLEDKILENPENFEDIYVCLAINMYKVFSLIPSQDFITYWNETSINNISKLHLAELVEIANSLASLAIYPDDNWIKNWWNRVKNNTDEINGNEINGNEISVMLRAMMIFDIERKATQPEELSIPAEIAEFLLNKEKINLFSRFNINSQKPIILPRMTYFAAKWFDYTTLTDRYNTKNETLNVSTIENRFVKAIENIKALRIQEKEPNNIGHVVDLSLLFNNQAIGIEIDGDCHFSYGRDGKIYYNGSTRGQTALNQKYQPEIILLRIPAIEINRILRNKELLKFIQNATTQQIGAHVVHNIHDIRHVNTPNA